MKLYSSNHFLVVTTVWPVTGFLDNEISASVLCLLQRSCFINMLHTCNEFSCETEEIWSVHVKILE